MDGILVENGWGRELVLVATMMGGRGWKNMGGEMCMWGHGE